jgi:hypothetical protein
MVDQHNVRSMRSRVGECSFWFVDLMAAELEDDDVALETHVLQVRPHEGERESHPAL